MDKFHLLFIDKNGKFQNKEKEFDNFKSCEDWLIKQKALDWQIGVSDKDIKTILKDN